MVQYQLACGLPLCPVALRRYRQCGGASVVAFAFGTI